MPPSPSLPRRRRLLLLLAAAAFLSPISSSESDHHHHHHPHHHADHSPSCNHHHHHEDHQHHHHHHHHEDHQDHHHHDDRLERRSPKLPEEIAEEEDLELYGFDYPHHSHNSPDPEFSTIGLWVRAMGCSLLVSMASLICLAFLPLIFVHGKPSRAVVDSLALFGAGAMLGDAFLHQLPHAFGGEHSHSHEHHTSNTHHHHHEHGHSPSHSHSLKDLSVGLSIMSGILLFLLVEKVVRYVEEHSGNGANLGHGHHHHKHYQKVKDDEDNHDDSSPKPDDEKDGDTMPGKKLLDDEYDGSLDGEKHSGHETLRKRVTSAGSTSTTDDRKDADAGDGSVMKKPSSRETAPPRLPSKLVFGYLNLFSDGVHNFTDGMALGSAFLLHGSVGGWSRTLFLLAHELPQEVGDFGILVRSGFSVSKALSFNFLSALVALAGTALALVLGKSPGQSSLIEGFTAGGFIYIAAAGVLPEMNSEEITMRSTAIQLISLVLGMAVALCISLVE